MKFSLSWLKDYLETEASCTDIAEKLTAIGLEVEDVTDCAKTLAEFKVAEIISAEPHPDADRLKLCQVKTLDGVIQVVCGAPNARAGLKGIYAPAGTYIPGLDVVLKKTKIRGIESCGMMVSEREMGLGENQNGIIDLPAETPIGTPMAEVFHLNDPVIEINVTPNRPDCAGVMGIARDLAAAGMGKFLQPNLPAIEPKFDSQPRVYLDFAPDQRAACPLFLGRLIKNVKNGPSPEWLQNRLKSVGLRPISALVDITNYFCLGMARPLHVYDADLLQGDLTVRMSRAGERLDALNDKDYELTDNMVAICDDRGVIGLGGIMGGRTTGCSEQTRNVYLECAYFDPNIIARAGRTLQVTGDARYRFERGIDPVFSFAAMELATHMILDLCGGEAGTLIQAGGLEDMADLKRSYTFDPAHYARLIGDEVSEDTQRKILTDLGFEFKSLREVTPPSWRPDILGSVDLMEEVARIRGLDLIPPRDVVASDKAHHRVETPLGSRTRRARVMLASRGLQECITWSFMDEALAHDFGADAKGEAKRLKLVNPISEDLVQMRPTILPNLMAAAARNHDRGYPRAALFEVGPVFMGPDQNEQPIVATGVRTAACGPRHWSGAENSRAVDVYDVKADALRLIEFCGGPNMGGANVPQITREAPAYYHPGRSGAIKMGDRVIAYFGELHPGLLEKMKITEAMAGFEVFIENIPPERKKPPSLPLVQLSPFQPVRRDFAFVVDRDVAADTLIRAIILVDRTLIKAVELFDVYRGDKIEPGKKSLAFEVTLQPQDHTFTDGEIDAISQKIVAMVTQKTGGVLRV